MPLNKETKPNVTYSAGDVEYASCISAEKKDIPHRMFWIWY